jgi:hypothetical protein
MAASAGSYSNLVDADFILDKRVVGGLQQVPLLLAERLGDDVFLSQPVRTSSTPRRGRHGRRRRVTVRARHAILALAPVLYNRISFVPPLPRLQHQMHQHISMGFVIKVHAVYETPFWRERACRARPSARTSSRTRPTTTRTTATSAARSSASSPTCTPTACSSCAEERKERILESLALLRPRGEEPRRLLRERLGQRGGRAARTRRASTSAACTATGPTCAPSDRSTSPAATSPARATSTSTVRSAWGASRRPDPRRDPRMSGHVVVGYTATKPGRDAVAFAARLAAALGAVLDVSIILPSADRSVITPPDDGYSGTCTRRPSTGSPRRSTASPPTSSRTRRSARPSRSRRAS